jgi:L-rhamnose mutarotase
MPIFPARELMNVEAIELGRANVPSLNLRFRHKPMRERLCDAANFSGAGIYGIILQERLVYIGSYLGDSGKGVAAFGGDVVSDRWWTHVAGISCRGHRVSFAPDTLMYLYDNFGENDLVNQLRAGDQKELVRPAACSVPKPRAIFAARNRNIFLDADAATILKLFTFAYVRIQQMPDGMNGEQLAVQIRETESSLIGEFRPPTNFQHMDGSAPLEGAPMQPAEFEEKLNTRMAGLVN